MTLNRSNYVPRLELLIPDGTAPQYTTLLQTGIIVESRSATTIGEFLSSLPGFTLRYISERIETIFLNGQPVDDLEAVLDGSSPVLAISAAMPGLAGAIFRKNSFHAALRTSACYSSPDWLQSSEKVMVRLKFFNMIAVERGGTILNNSCQFKSDSVLRFIRYRPELFSAVLSVSYDNKPVDLDSLETVLNQSETVFLKIQEENVGT